MSQASGIRVFRPWRSPTFGVVALVEPNSAPLIHMRRPSQRWRSQPGKSAATTCRRSDESFARFDAFIGKQSDRVNLVPTRSRDLAISCRRPRASGACATGLRLAGLAGAGWVVGADFTDDSAELRASTSRGRLGAASPADVGRAGAGGCEGCDDRTWSAGVVSGRPPECAEAAPVRPPPRAGRIMGRSRAVVTRAAWLWLILGGTRRVHETLNGGRRSSTSPTVRPPELRDHQRLSAPITGRRGGPLQGGG